MLENIPWPGVPDPIRVFVIMRAHEGDEEAGQLRIRYHSFAIYDHLGGLLCEEDLHDLHPNLLPTEIVELCKKPNS